MLFRQRIKAFAHVVELPSFAQDRTGMHWIPSFLRTQKKKASHGLTWFRAFEGGVLADLPPDSNSPSKSSKCASVHGVGSSARRRDLAAPTTVSPAPATEQKQHQENNQYGFHFVTSFVRGSRIGL
jgi:hypothetical protein